MLTIQVAIFTLKPFALSGDPLDPNRPQLSPGTLGQVVQAKEEHLRKRRVEERARLLIQGIGCSLGMAGSP